MNIMRKYKFYKRYAVWACGVIAMSTAGLLYFMHDDKPVSHIRLEAQALESVDSGRINSIGEEIRRLNPLRKAAGLTEIEENWNVALTRFQVMDGPQITVIVDEANVPVKLVTISGAWGLPGFFAQEYEVSNKKFNGRAATWIGKPPKLLMVETFIDNKLNGSTIYYSADGDEISRCEFRDGKPWTGRTLERDGFEQIGRDVSYKKGKLHGEERTYQDGKLYSVTTFRAGVQNGPQQQYYQGQLRSEAVYENGIRTSVKSWYQNGTLQEETHLTAEGRNNGVRRMWNKAGELELEEHYQKGKEHGRRWWKGQQELWFWKGKGIGSGSAGRAEFERRQSKEEKGGVKSGSNISSHAISGELLKERVISSNG